MLDSARVEPRVVSQDVKPTHKLKSSCVSVIIVFCDVLLLYCLCMIVLVLHVRIKVMMISMFITLVCTESCYS